MSSEKEDVLLRGGQKHLFVTGANCHAPTQEVSLRVENEVVNDIVIFDLSSFFSEGGFCCFLGADWGRGVIDFGKYCRKDHLTRCEAVRFSASISSSKASNGPKAREV
jgi:hypothetical protein